MRPHHTWLLVFAVVYFLTACQFMVSGRWAVHHDYPAIKDCEVTSVPGSQLVSLKCKLKTINSNLEITNFSAIPAMETDKLQIECSQMLFFQSALLNNSFYHLVNLENLDIRYCKIGEIPRYAFSGLSKLKNLTIKTYNTEWTAMSLTISSNAFQEQIQLVRLDLASNNIWTLPEKLFCNLDHLVFLNMSRNKLQRVEALSFGNYIGRCARRLRFLDLSFNNFMILPQFSFEALKNLTHLNISTNGVREIADQVFFGMYSLEMLDISGNLLTTLPPELFKENKRLTKFYAQNNTISVLAPGLFTGLDMLLELDLGHNNLSSTWVNSETFMGLIRLATLDLSFNNIARLDMATFRDLTNLQRLNLQDNIISYIADHTFSGLFRLHTLLLANNKLTVLEANTFRGLTALTDLNANHNELIRIHREALGNSTILKNLHLKNNSLEEVPSVVHKLENLKTLDLSDNRINKILDTSFEGLLELSALYLEDNYIDNLTKHSLSPLVALQVLNCGRNYLKTIENGAFDKNPKLKAIRLDDNRLSNVHGLFTNLSELRWLNISKNRLDMFDYAFIPRELEYLDLRHNFLNELGNHFKIESQLQLKVLDASFNRIVVISAISIPDSIEIIFLNNNNITNVQPYTFFKKKNLTRVDLFANQIRSMDQTALRLSILDPTKPVPEFYLAENPFECDCTFEWLQTVNIQEEPHQSPRVVDLTSIMCHLLSRRGTTFVPLLETHKLQFLCQYNSHCFSLCRCCDYDACDCEMICPPNCTCFHDDSWTANIVDCSTSQQQSIPKRIPMDASEVYLDGNELFTLSSHSFIGRKNLRVLYLNGSQISEVYNRTFNGLRKLKILYLNHNNIGILKGHEFERLTLLKELYLHYNRIYSLSNSTFVPLMSLEILRLDGNLLTSISANQFSENILLKSLWLGDNKLTCTCNFIETMKNWLVESNKLIADKENFICFINNTKVVHIPSYVGECSAKNLTTSYQHMVSKDYLFFPTISLGVCALILTVILIIFCNRGRMRVWMYAKYGVRLFHKSKIGEDSNKLFDAFVSYSSKDERFVTQILAPELERGSPSYKLCLHYRDFPAGSFVSDTIFSAVDSSKRTILVISENFIKSEWSKYDFRSAHHEILRDRKKRLIVILLGDVPQKDLDPDLKLYLKTNTFLKWGDARFWEKLKYAMPDARPPSRTHQLRSLNQSIASSASQPSTLEHPHPHNLTQSNHTPTVLNQHSTLNQHTPNVLNQHTSTMLNSHHFQQSFNTHQERHRHQHQFQHSMQNQQFVAPTRRSINPLM